MRNPLLKVATFLRTDREPEVPMSTRRRWFVAACAAIPVTGLLTIVFYAAGAEDSGRVFASAIMLSLAATVSGGLVGFLFGVPRSPGAGDAGTTPSATLRGKYLANTNLEQISDWLTKILVGVGLTQVGPIHSALKRLITSVEPALGARPDSGAFGAALLICFAVSGFVCGWLATRLMLTPALSDLECALDKLDRADTELRSGNTDRALELQADGINALAKRYELLRELLPSGEHRSTEIKTILAKARQQARDAAWTAPQARKLFDSGTDGNRVYSLALMSESAELGDLDRIATAIETPRSKTEQITALRAACRLKPNLGSSDRQRLRDAIQQQLDKGDIPVPSEREEVARQFLDGPD